MPQKPVILIFTAVRTSNLTSWPRASKLRFVTFFQPEGEGNISLRNVSIHVLNCTEIHPNRWKWNLFLWANVSENISCRWQHHLCIYIVFILWRLVSYCKRMCICRPVQVSEAKSFWWILFYRQKEKLCRWTLSCRFGVTTFMVATNPPVEISKGFMCLYKKLQEIRPELSWVRERKTKHLFLSYLEHVDLIWGWSCIQCSGASSRDELVSAEVRLAAISYLLAGLGVLQLNSL